MSPYALVFPGQGSQYVGMGQKFSSDDRFRRTMEKALEILGSDYARVLESGPDSELSQTQWTQPLTYAVSYALFDMLDSQYDLSPVLVAGHSLGELTALTVSGAIRFEDGLNIVKARGQLMSRTQPGAMAAILGLDVDSVLDLCANASNDRERLTVANFNSEQQTIVAGTRSALDEAQRRCDELRVRFVRLNVSAPFHTPFMADAAKSFEEVLLGYEYSPLRFPVLSNVDAQYYLDETEIPVRLARQMVSPVQWKSSMDRIAEIGVETILEIGPKNVIKGLFQQHKRAKNVYAMDVASDLEKIRPFFSNASRALEACLKHVVSTKNYGKSFGESESAEALTYRNLLNRYYEDLEHDRSPKPSTIGEAIELLNRTFEIKKTPIEQRRTRWLEVADCVHDRVSLRTIETYLAELSKISEKVSRHDE